MGGKGTGLFVLLLLLVVLVGPNDDDDESGASGVGSVDSGGSSLAGGLRLWQ